MCGCPEPSKTASTEATTTDMNNLNVEAEDSFDSLLEFASNNDVDGLKLSMERDSSPINEAGVWYSRGKGSKHVVTDYRTPLMVAATYGNVDVLKAILSCPEVDVNLSCGVHDTTALHCAASAGSLNSVDVVRLLLSAGADPNRADGNGQRPADVVVAHPKVASMKSALEELLSGVARERKEYPMDPSIPDIKNSMYATDEFRMFSFKVRPCSRAYSHDWTECPFVHPGENARRRDPRKFHYSCVPCPEFRKGACRRGDLCEYAHGVFECWLHPAQYRTRLCKDGTACGRRVCFFAHRSDELRPLYANNVNSPPPSPFGQPMSPFGQMSSSRLRSSLCARDIQPDDLNMLLEFDAQQQLMRRPPSNLEDLFSEMSLSLSSSPRYSDSHLSSFSPTHKSALMNQFQQQQSMLKPINTVDHHLMFGGGLPLSPGRSLDPISPMAPARREKQLRRELAVGSPVSPWSNPNWGASDWCVNNRGGGGGEEAFEVGNNNAAEEPDLSWVQSLVKDSPAEMIPAGGGGEREAQPDHSVLGAWVEQMQLA